MRKIHLLKIFKILKTRVNVILLIIRNNNIKINAIIGV